MVIEQVEKLKLMNFCGFFLITCLIDKHDCYYLCFSFGCLACKCDCLGTSYFQGWREQNHDIGIRSLKCG